MQCYLFFVCLFIGEQWFIFRFQKKKQYQQQRHKETEAKCLGSPVTSYGTAL